MGENNTLIDNTEMIEIHGEVERVVYYNRDNGFTVLRMCAQTRPQNFSATGKLAAEPAAGENLLLKGVWIADRKWGRQFKIEECTSALPVTANGIEKFLASGLIKNVGAATAKKIVEKFGEETIDIIDNTPERLAEIQGISEKKAGQIAESWREQREIRDVMVFLQQYGIGVGYAMKIFRQYGSSAIEVMKNNPYRIAIDIDGIGFATADGIAQKLGFSHDSPERVQAGIRSVLNMMTGEGHVFLPRTLLAEKSAIILSVSEAQADKGVEDARLAEDIVVESYINDENKEAEAVYLPALHYCETHSAINLKNIIDEPYKSNYIDCDEVFPEMESLMGIKFADTQKEAIRTAINSKVMIITGGPGTGKTTIIQAVLSIRENHGARVFLAAPTGRAAKRMSEATGHEAKTVHRLLESEGGVGSDCAFMRNDTNPLECDLLIIDEASMIDQVLFHHLLKAVPSSASLILVGDVDQLPSVSSGNVLNDIIESEICPVVRLTEIFRQSSESRIIVNAHRVNRGEMPLIGCSPNEKTDFYFAEPKISESCFDNENDYKDAFSARVLEIVKVLVSERIPKIFGFDPVNDIQVLTPVHNGLLGTKRLNIELQKLLNNGTGSTLQRGEVVFKVGDKVMQIKNNYDKEVYNGDIGTIDEIDNEEHAISVKMDSGIVIYDYSELDELTHAYAVTIHKSQGSEYPAVVIPLTTMHYVMLKRNLLYTGITRGKKLVVIVGMKKAVSMAVHDDTTSKRYTRLAERLKNNAPINTLDFDLLPDDTL